MDLTTKGTKTTKVRSPEGLPFVVLVPFVVKICLGFGCEGVGAGVF